MTRHLTDDELVLRYYGEMTDAAEAQASLHLDGCEDCRRTLARLHDVLAIVDSGATPDVDASWESRMWQRLAPALRTERPARARWPARLAWAAAAASLVLAGFVGGRMASPPAPPAVVESALPPAAHRVLDADLGDHLDRAELALVDFLMRTDGASSTAATEDLIAANRLYRATAMALGYQTVVGVLDELERALIEIAAAPPDATDAERADVREWIDSRELLFKVRVMRDTLGRPDVVTAADRQDSSL